MSVLSGSLNDILLCKISVFVEFTLKSKKIKL